MMRLGALVMAVGSISPLYLKLIRRFPLRPIRTEEELQHAIAVIDSLVVRMDGLAPEEQDYLDVLSDLVEKYESEIYPEPDVPPHVMLRELIAFRGVTQTEVARTTGIGESVLSEILRGKRKIGRKTIERLTRYFHVDPSLFFPPVADG
jgi:HTH-type transcriptional regulator/antitoxin HigA